MPALRTKLIYTSDCPDCEWLGHDCKEHQENESDEAIIARTYFSGVVPYTTYYGAGKIMQSLKMKI